MLPPAADIPPSLAAPPFMALPAAWLPPLAPDEVFFPLQPSANGVPRISTRMKGRAFWIIFMASPANEDVLAELSALASQCGIVHIVQLRKAHGTVHLLDSPRSHPSPLFFIR
jgi:hypothetical protein